MTTIFSRIFLWFQRGKIEREKVLFFLLGGGYAYLRGVCLLFLPIFPWAMLILGATLIRNSRVVQKNKAIYFRLADINFPLVVVL